MPSSASWWGSKARQFRAHLRAGVAPEERAGLVARKPVAGRSPRRSLKVSPTSKPSVRCVSASFASRASASTGSVRIALLTSRRAPSPVAVSLRLALSKSSFQPSGRKKGSGLSPRARFSPCAAASAVTSRRRDGTPALAKCAAIWEPMTPAPSTATERMIIECESESEAPRPRRCGTQHSPRRARRSRSTPPVARRRRYR